MSGRRIERLRGRQRTAPAEAENGGLEGVVGDQRGEIRRGDVAGQSRRDEAEGLAGLDGGSLEGMAGRDDDRVGHERPRNRAQELVGHGLPMTGAVGFRLVGFGRLAKRDDGPPAEPGAAVSLLGLVGGGGHLHHGFLELHCLEDPLSLSPSLSLSSASQAYTNRDDGNEGVSAKLHDSRGQLGLVPRFSGGNEIVAAMSLNSGTEKKTESHWREREREDGDGDGDDARKGIC